jgi:hypothetical protein
MKLVLHVLKEEVSLNIIVMNVLKTIMEIIYIISYIQKKEIV